MFPTIPQSYRSSRFSTPIIQGKIFGFDQSSSINSIFLTRTDILTPSTPEFTTYLVFLRQQVSCSYFDDFLSLNSSSNNCHCFETSSTPSACWSQLLYTCTGFPTLCSLIRMRRCIAARYKRRDWWVGILHRKSLLAPYSGKLTHPNLARSGDTRYWSVGQVREL